MQTMSFSPARIVMTGVIALASLAAAAGCRAGAVGSSPPAEQTARTSGVPARTLGAMVPDFAFRNQDDRPLRLSEFRGRVVVATFLYTRCPFPDYCPRLMARLTGVRRLLLRDPAVWNRVQMLAITIDPSHDTPSVLRAYGQSMLGERPFEHLDLVTGSAAVVDQLAASFGVTYREESGQLIHTLATALIDRDGRVVNVIDGSDWSPEDVAAAIRAAVPARRPSRP
jgi:protein SCO1/2